MKYLYKNTGVVVESGQKLDSLLYTPVEETKEKEEAPKKTAPKKKG